MIQAADHLTDVAAMRPEVSWCYLPYLVITSACERRLRMWDRLACLAG